MRDPERIDRICDMIRTVWKTVPDWRLGQLIFNLTREYDCFYVEDDVIENMLRTMIENIENRKEYNDATPKDN